MATRLGSEQLSDEGELRLLMRFVIEMDKSNE